MTKPFPRSPLIPLILSIRVVRYDSDAEIARRRAVRAKRYEERGPRP